MTDSKDHIPPVIDVDPDGIPDELKPIPQWVSWQYETRRGKPTKMPKNARSGSNAKTNDPSTFSTFDAALADYRERGRDGVGFVFTEEDDFCGIDLDACRDPETGKLTEWAQEIVTSINSYTEVSPSGYGVKIVVKARLCHDKHVKKHKGVAAFGTKAPETAIYDRKRFWCMTGKLHSPTHNKIQHRQAEIDALCGELWPVKAPARKSRRPKKTRALQFEQLLDECAATPVGERSEVVWKLLCTAIRLGMSREELWSRVAHVGRFQEKGREHFDREWVRAEREVDMQHADYTPSSAPVDLPKVALPGDDVTITSAAARLGQLLAGSGRFYDRGGVPVRLIENREDRRLEPIRPAAFCSDLETVARLICRVSTKDGELLLPTICSEASARLLLEAESLREQLPQVTVISRCPVLIERDGHLVEISGYDRQSGILAAGAPTPTFSMNEAADLLGKLVDDFRFATQADRARALAGFLTPALAFGDLLGGRAPVDLGEADDSQAGKGYRNRLTAAIYRDRPATVTQRSGGVGSMQEAFDSKLVAGSPFISLDNIRGKQDLPWLESFLTEINYPARIPYRAPMLIETRRIIVMLTSNSAETSPDLAKRASCVRILKQSVGYQFTAYSQGDLLDHVIAQQPLFLGAVFAVIRAWHQRGKPVLKSVDHDFRRWARVLGYIVQEILGAGPLLEGHRAAQERISSPGLTWLREVCLAVQRAGKLEQWLRAHQILEILVDAEMEDVDVDDHEEWLKATQSLGRKLSRCFRGDTTSIDAIRVERREEKDEAGRRKHAYAFLSASPNPPNASPDEITAFPNSPNGSETITRTHAHGESSEAIGGIGGPLGEESERVELTI